MSPDARLFTSGRLLLSIALCVRAVSSVCADERPTIREEFDKARRIVFLGDSITAAGQYVAYVDAWLTARPDKAREFMRAYPANWLLANPVEKKGTKPKPLF